MGSSPSHEQPALDLPNDALALVLSTAAPTVEDRSRLACTNKQFKDVLYGDPTLWDELCLKALRMTAVEADSLVQRAGGDLKKLVLEAYKKNDKGDKDLPEGCLVGCPKSVKAASKKLDAAAVPFAIATREDWDTALQSVCVNDKLESIELVADYCTCTNGVHPCEREESAERCVTACLDALCAIAKDLPKSIKTLDLHCQGLKLRHVRALEASPPCVDGELELDFEACSEDDDYNDDGVCGNVQTKTYCCNCKEKFGCSECHQAADYDEAMLVEQCQETWQETPFINDKNFGNCTNQRCHRQACRDEFPYSECPHCNILSCADCVAKRGRCSDCDVPICGTQWDSMPDGGRCLTTLGEKCGTCGTQTCRGCTSYEVSAWWFCKHPGCGAVECYDCDNMTVCDGCSEASCRSHGDVLPCQNCHQSFHLGCARDAGHTYGDTKFRKTRQTGKTGRKGNCPETGRPPESEIFH